LTSSLAYKYSRIPSFIAVVAPTKKKKKKRKPKTESQVMFEFLGWT
jgi:hypothetical protein